MANALTHRSIIADLKQKVYQPVYFLMGEEPYYIDLIANYIEEKVLDDSEKDFNQTILYGNDVDILAIVDHSKRFPMMAERQVVIVKEAQHLSRQIEKLEAYLKDPSPTTLLVICYKYKTIDKRKSFGKFLSQSGFLFHSEKIKDWNLPEWISGYTSSKGYKISSKNSVLLSEHLGNDLSKIVNELDKAFINIERGGEITAEVIERDIGISKEFNNFELNNALARKDILKTNRIITHFSSNPKNHPLVLNMSMLYNFFSKILAYHYTADKSQNNLASALKVHPFIIKEYQLAAKNYSARKALNIISLLREYDMKSKGFNNSSTTDAELLKELVYKILH